MFRLTLSSSARDHLVNELRAKGISDERVLVAIGAVDRGLFVPENFHFMAHDDVSWFTARNQFVCQPFIVATMAAALGLTDRCNVLENEHWLGLPNDGVVAFVSVGAIH